MKKDSIYSLIPNNRLGPDCKKINKFTSNPIYYHPPFYEFSKFDLADEQNMTKKTFSLLFVFVINVINTPFFTILLL